jgi:hypothetical protein
MYFDNERVIRHMTPDKRPVDKKLEPPLEYLPWKQNQNWIEFIRISKKMVKALSKIREVNYSLLYPPRNVIRFLRNG